MPGFNKMGPQNKGAMTGRRLGPCICDSAETQDKQVFDQKQTNGGRRTGGAGRCGGRGLGRGANSPAGSGRGRGMRGQPR